MSVEKPSNTLTITARQVVVVEGKDDELFISAFLKHLSITDYQIVTVDTNKFRVKIEALKNLPNFDKVKRIIAIRDADNNARSAFQSICDALARADLQPPAEPNTFSGGVLDVGVYIMPGNGQEGMLEDCCLQSVHDHPAMSCVNAFSDCTATLPNPPRNISKSRAQAYLAAREEYVKDIGTAAQKGYWNFEAETLRELREFLLTLHAE